jgi:phosphoglycolate phosphatase-like HAD superfamily hydrolase
VAVRVVAFDFDGTLVQSNAIKRDAFYGAVRSFGDLSDVVRQVLAENPGDRYVITATIATRAADRLPPAGERPWAEVFADRYTRICEEQILECPFVPGAIECLEALRRDGRLLYVNSATPGDPLRSVVRRRGLDGYFAGVWGNERGKADNLRRALAECAAAPGELAFVGDSEADGAAALEVGCHFVGVLNQHSDFRQRPAAVVEDLHGLGRLVGAMA